MSRSILSYLSFNFYCSCQPYYRHANMMIRETFYGPRLAQHFRTCSAHDTKFFYYLVRKGFQNDEEWRLFYFDSTLGCRVIKDFDLCKLDECDVTKGTQSGAKN